MLVLNQYNYLDNASCMNIAKRVTNYNIRFKWGVTHFIIEEIVMVINPRPLYKIIPSPV